VFPLEGKTEKENDRGRITASSSKTRQANFSEKEGAGLRKDFHIGGLISVIFTEIKKIRKRRGGLQETQG